jgi:NAD-dependent SIR2 family protein deacetylase
MGKSNCSNCSKNLKPDEIVYDIHPKDKEIKVPYCKECYMIFIQKTKK